jgi:hypothetical protein
MSSIIPDGCLCPITQTVMMDPVIAPDGFTYERSAIEEWLQRTGKSPMTRQTMQVNQLIPNRALADTIQQLKTQERAGLSVIYHDGQWRRENISNIELISDRFAQLVFLGNRVYKVHAGDIKFLVNGVISFATQLEADAVYTILYHDGQWKRAGTSSSEGVSRKYAQLIIRNATNEIILAHADDMRFLFSGILTMLL